MQNDIKMVFHGWQNDATLSSIFMSCHCAATGLPRHCLGKSGSVAALIAHGLPVIAPLTTKGGLDPFLISKLETCIVEKPTLASIQLASHNARDAINLISVNRIAKIYMASLQ
jgi:hypothetical protein